MKFGVALGFVGACALGCTSSIVQGPEDPSRFGDRDGLTAIEREAPPVDEIDEPSEPELPEIGTGAPEEPGTVSSGGLEVIDAVMRASFVNGVAVAGDATDITSFNEPGWLDLQIMRAENSNAAMALMYLDADLDSPTFSRVGSLTRFENGNMVEGPEGADDNMFFSYQGCAGEQAYNWDFDEPAEEIVIGVEEGPNEGDRVVNVEATIGFTGDSGTISIEMLLTE